jgi:hypothetical protein
MPQRNTATRGARRGIVPLPNAIELILIFNERRALLHTLSHRKIHAEDCADCDTKDGNIGEITRDTAIAGAVTGAERARLMGIADRCPVHQTLTHKVKMRSSLVS